MPTIKDLEWTHLSEDVVLALDEDGVIAFANQAVEGVLGYRPEALIGLKCYDDVLEAMDNQGRNLYIVGAEGCDAIYMRHSSGFFLPMLIKHYADEKSAYTLVMLSPKPSMKTLPHEMTDALTHLANRSYTEKWMAMHLDFLHETQRQVACILVDLDNFEPFNQTYGRLLGDRMLYIAAKSIYFASQDALLISRLQSDEFLVVYAGIRLKTLKEKAEQIRLVLESTLLGDVRERSLYASASLGGSFSQGHEDWPSFYKRLLTHLKRAKAQDGNHIYVK